jgi:hypothetical protein
LTKKKRERTDIDKAMRAGAKEAAERKAKAKAKRKRRGR